MSTVPTTLPFPLTTSPPEPLEAQPAIEVDANPERTSDAKSGIVLIAQQVRGTVGRAVRRAIDAMLDLLFPKPTKAEKQAERIKQWRMHKEPRCNLDTAESLLRMGLNEPAAFVARTWLEYVVRSAVLKHLDAGGKMFASRSLSNQLFIGQRAGLFPRPNASRVKHRIAQTSRAAHGGRLSHEQVASIIAEFRLFARRVQGGAV